jgi:[ribosomal protein S18]-alanine N-acetyltransferase
MGDEESVRIRPLAGPDEAAVCARLMAGSEPWLTLGRTFEASLLAIVPPDREVLVAEVDGAFAGFLVLTMAGPFRGYVQSICVTPERRSHGVGRRLLQAAEERILREAPNVFMCVSSFNPRARRLYEALGYEAVGELRDYLIPGASEVLLRKSVGPWSAFRAAKAE